MLKRLCVAVLCGLLLIGMTGAASGHSGGLDQSGGHHCRQRGYDSGKCAPLNSYHCHQCRGEAPPAEREPAPRAPADEEPPARPVVHEAKAAGNRVTLTVTGERSARLVVATGSQILHRATATGDSQSLEFVAPDGAHDLVVTATDAAGNESPAATSKVTIDSVAPAPPGVIIEPASPGKPDTKVRLSGEAGGTARLQALRPDGTAAQDWMEHSMSSGSAVVGLRLPNGAYTVQALVVDKAGNASGVTSVPTDVAIGKPAAPRLRLTSDQGASPVRIEVKGDPHTTATVVISGGDRDVERTVTLGGSGAGFVSAPLEDGSYEAEAVLADFQEQPSEVAKLKRFVIKAAPPVLDVVPIEEAMDDGSIAIAFRTEKGAKLRVTSTDGSLAETITGTGGVQKLVLAAGKGTHSLRFEAVDRYGNRAELTSEVLVSQELGAGGGMLLLALLGGAGWGGTLLWRRRSSRNGTGAAPGEA